MTMMVGIWIMNDGGDDDDDDGCGYDDGVG